MLGILPRAQQETSAFLPTWHDSLTGSLAHPVTDWDWATRYRDDNIKYKTNTTTYNTALPTGVGRGTGSAVSASTPTQFNFLKF